MITETLIVNGVRVETEVVYITPTQVVHTTLLRTAASTYEVRTAGRHLGWVRKVEQRYWTATLRRDGETIRLGRFVNRSIAIDALVDFDLQGA